MSFIILKWSINEFKVSFFCFFKFFILSGMVQIIK